jgi:hypothetical protein
LWVGRPQPAVSWGSLVFPWSKDRLRLAWGLLLRPADACATSRDSCIGLPAGRINKPGSGHQKADAPTGQVPDHAAQLEPGGQGPRSEIEKTADENREGEGEGERCHASREAVQGREGKTQARQTGEAPPGKTGVSPGQTRLKLHQFVEGGAFRPFPGAEGTGSKKAYQSQTVTPHLQADHRLG